VIARIDKVTEDVEQRRWSLAALVQDVLFRSLAKRNSVGAFRTAPIPSEMALTTLQRACLRGLPAMLMAGGRVAPRPARRGGPAAPAALPSQ
jgi:hypothetical protein